MDYVPFTLFFMVLLSFQGSVMGKPADDADIKAPWAQNCEEQLKSRNYCTERPEHGYPSDDKLKKLYFDNIDKFDFRPQINETTHRDGDGKNICRFSEYLVENVYMIRDENENIRYALHIPGIYEVAIPISECKPNANKMLDSEYKVKKIRCEQRSFKYPYIVLSQDMNSFESVKILGLNSSCVPIQY